MIFLLLIPIIICCAVANYLVWTMDFATAAPPRQPPTADPPTAPLPLDPLDDIFWDDFQRAVNNHAALSVRR